MEAEDHFFDLEETHDFMWIKGWCCMSCGHAVDLLIAANRRSHDAMIRVLLSEEPDNEKKCVSLGRATTEVAE